MLSIEERFIEVKVVEDCGLEGGEQTAREVLNWKAVRLKVMRYDPAQLAANNSLWKSMEY